MSTKEGGEEPMISIDRKGNVTSHADLRDRREVRIYHSRNFQGLWEGVLRKGFMKCLERSCKDALSSLVLIPSHQERLFLKGTLVREGLGTLGVLFLTPSECRSYLLKKLSLLGSVASRESLHLLASLVAQDSNSDLLGEAMAADPSEWLRCLDALWSAGWTESQLEPSQLGEWGATLRSLVKGCGLRRVQEWDRELKDILSDRPPVFEEVFIHGFHGGHGALGDLLQAVVRSAREATVTLYSPRAKAETLDQVWLGSWEEKYGSSEALSTAAELSSPYGELAEKWETFPQGADQVLLFSRESARIQWKVTPNHREEIRAIVGTILQFLAQGECERVGVIFVRSNLLARGVSSELVRLGVPHHDGFGHPPGVPRDEDLWKGWLDFQSRPTLRSLVEFARRFPEVEAVLGLRKGEAIRILERMIQESLIDKLEVVEELLKSPNFECGSELREGLHRLLRFPERTALQQWIELTERALEVMGLGDRVSVVRSRSQVFRGIGSRQVSKEIYLRWLHEIFLSSEKTRDPLGDHPYARVVLLSLAEAEFQTFSHSILCGLNDDPWDSVEDSAFLSEDRVKALNRRVLQSGSQGEGHEVFREGFSFLLGPAEKRAIAERQCLNVLENVQKSLAITCALEDELNPDRPLGVGEFLSQLYFIERGKPLTDEDLRELQRRTLWEMDSAGLDFESRRVSVPSFEFLTAIYRQRRDPSVAFGRFEFSFEEGLSIPTPLSCKEWEEALKRPATTWMRRYLGVEGGAKINEEDFTPIARGIWVHRWLAEAIDNRRFVEKPDLSDGGILPRIQQAAEKTRIKWEELSRETGQALSSWWLSDWREALFIAEQIAVELEPILCDPMWKHSYPEWKLPGNLKIPISGPEFLVLSGRIDLLLSTGEISKGVDDPQPLSIWLIDFKTGRKQPLSKGRMVRGDGVQLGLYALALHAMGLDKIQMSICKPEEPLSFQLSLEQVLEIQDLWKTLVRMQNEGVFGMLETLRADFGERVPLPFATLPIAEETLEMKWGLTHPLLKKA